uniref:Uncharacterized protein n=1 Tax=Glossina pallidipes TaxID=7398 RepID=A0A1B0AB42_GLOPL
MIEKFSSNNAEGNIPRIEEPSPFAIARVGSKTCGGEGTAGRLKSRMACHKWNDELEIPIEHERIKKAQRTRVRKNIDMCHPLHTYKKEHRLSPLDTCLSPKQQNSLLSTNCLFILLSKRYYDTTLIF